MEEKKKRGRPPLPPELKKPYKRSFKSSKEGGYESQRLYREAHREEIKERDKKRAQKRMEIFFAVQIFIPRENRPYLDSLCKETESSMRELFFNAFKETYGVDISKPISTNEDNPDKG